MLVFNQRKSRARSETTRAGAYNRGTFKSSSAMSSASARDLDASSFKTISSHQEQSWCCFFAATSELTPEAVSDPAGLVHAHQGPPRLANNGSSCYCCLSASAISEQRQLLLQLPFRHFAGLPAKASRTPSAILESHQSPGELVEGHMPQMRTWQLAVTAACGYWSHDAQGCVKSRPQQQSGSSCTGWDGSASAPANQPSSQTAGLGGRGQTCPCDSTRCCRGPIAGT